MSACVIGWLMIGSVVALVLWLIIAFIIDNWEDIQDFFITIGIVILLVVWFAVAIGLISHCK